MNKVIPRLEWLGGFDNVSLVRRDMDEHIMFDLYLENGELLTKPTQPLWSDEAFPALQPGCVWVKNYSEHQGLGDALVKVGVLKRTGRRVEFGPYDASSDEYWLTPEFGGTEAEYTDHHVTLQAEDIGGLEVLVGMEEIVGYILGSFQDKEER